MIQARARVYRSHSSPTVRVQGLVAWSPTIRPCIPTIQFRKRQSSTFYENLYIIGTGTSILSDICDKATIGKIVRKR
jgi:hypothetical protein